MKNRWVLITLILIWSTTGIYSQLKPNQLRISGKNLVDGNGQVVRGLLG